ncbi:hypothetical protein NF702_04445 [Lactococcus petauri]|jgi:hypothetical protein|uniref:hypothetical protein n=1 Tax=Lactococcus TaxID=1357 RepID=UPI000314DC76|nr:MULTISPECIES: hypothetical protein [Lactococcus]MDG6136499.1 hypothetical protein [Lactococcus petauri]MDT2726987.1 hypothetical protein [Lactococcus formosensis]NHI67577.1 hypothetical protein [Lactococcus garvieae]
MNNILISFGLPIITGLLSFLAAIYTSKKNYQAKTNELAVKIKELDQKLIEQASNHKHELERMKQSHEHQLEMINVTSKVEQDSNMQNAITGILANSFGNVLENAMGDIQSVEDLQDFADKFKTTDNLSE